MASNTAIHFKDNLFKLDGWIAKLSNGDGVNILELQRAIEFTLGPITSQENNLYYQDYRVTLPSLSGYNYTSIVYAYAVCPDRKCWTTVYDMRAGEKFCIVRIYNTGIYTGTTPGSWLRFNCSIQLQKV